MSDLPFLYVVIPIYNELENIPTLVASLNRLDAAIAEFKLYVIFSDDGSTDGTPGQIDKATLAPDHHVIANPKNRGPGAAVAAAFAYLTTRLTDVDWVMTMEGDNTSDPATVIRMLTRRKEGYEMVMASVYAYGGGFQDVQWHRLLLSYTANEIVKCKLRIYGLHTLSSFFRLYSAPLIRRLNTHYGNTIIDMDGFGWAVEMLYKCIVVSATITEIETRVDWSQRQGKSKMKLLRTAREYVHILAGHSRWKRVVDK